MTRVVADAQLDVFKPGETEPFLTVPGDDLETVETSERIQDAMDSGAMTIANHDAGYSGITTGDRLEFKVQLAEETQLETHWTAVARTVTDSLEGGRRQRLEIEATDFVFTVLSWRLAYETFDGDPITGSSNAILDTLLEEAPEIGTGQIATISTTTDGFYNGRDLLSIVTEDLAPIADAIVAQDGTDLVFKPLADISPTAALAPTDFRGGVGVSRSDEQMANLVRVDGGTDHDSDAEQTVQDGTERVTDTNRVTTQIETRKSEVDRVLVHTVPDATSSDGITVRLQADRGGAPVDADDPTSDIAKKTLAAEFLAEDDWTTFILPAHTLAPQAFPWLIIEANGPDGHEIGIDTSTGEPTYRAEYPFPLLTRIPDAQSQQEYRRRDHRIKDESIDSFTAVQDKARSYLRHHNGPERTLSGEAETVLAHSLSPGDAVTMREWDRVGVSGTWLVRERETSFNAGSNRLSTTLTLQEAVSV